MAVSQNGWKASADPSEINVKSFMIPGTDRKIRLNADCAPILLAFCAEFDKKVESIDGGVLDDWGYAYRPVRGQDVVLSNHASGTAVDLNAPRHPLGKANTFTLKQRIVISQLIKKYGINWGGLYKNRKDDMHFEIVETPAQVKARIKKLNLTPQGYVAKPGKTA